MKKEKEEEMRGYYINDIFGVIAACGNYEMYAGLKEYHTDLKEKCKNWFETKEEAEKVAIYLKKFLQLYRDFPQKAKEALEEGRIFSNAPSIISYAKYLEDKITPEKIDEINYAYSFYTTFIRDRYENMENKNIERLANILLFGELTEKIIEKYMKS
jgi:hypothetical protein